MTATVYVHTPSCKILDKVGESWPSVNATLGLVPAIDRIDVDFLYRWKAFKTLIMKIIITT